MHDVQLTDTYFAQNCRYYGVTCTVKRRIYDIYAVCRAKTFLQHSVCVGGNQLFFYGADKTVGNKVVVVVAVHFKWVYFLDVGRNFVGNVVKHLATRVVVHFVAVVFLGVVAGGHVYAHVRAECAYCVGQKRRGHAVVGDVHDNAVCRKYSRRFFAEFTRVKARVVCDCGGRQPVRLHVVCQALCCLGDGVFVKTVCPRTHFAACAEFEVFVECVGNLNLGHLFKRGKSSLVGYVVQPVPVILFCFVHNFLRTGQFFWLIFGIYFTTHYIVAFFGKNVHCFDTAC